MNYQEAMDYLETYSTLGSVYGLAGIARLLDHLDQPQAQLPIIHIAGTNGKGSTVAYLYHILLAQGYRVGRYTSPTLFSYRERIEADGAMISKAQVATYMSQIAEACSEILAAGFPHPTVFEMELAMAYLFARDEQCDFFIQETGLGGRYDATNIVEKPLLTFITAIDLDHQALLGDTLEKIAAEKAGIIKAGVPVLTSNQNPIITAVLKQQAHALSAPYCAIAADQLTAGQQTIAGQDFVYRGAPYHIALLGAHQLENAALAVEGIFALRKLGYVISDQSLQQGLANTVWPGRFERIAKAPFVILDGAHNQAAARVLIQALEQYFPAEKKIFVLSMFQDKDYEAIIALTTPYAATIITTTTANPRALSATALAEVVAKYHNDVRPYADLTDACQAARTLAEPADVIVVFGSLSHLHDARMFFTGEENYD